jgi:hypothetical protein
MIALEDARERDRLKHARSAEVRASIQREARTAASPDWLARERSIGSSSETREAPRPEMFAFVSTENRRSNTLSFREVRMKSPPLALALKLVTSSQ